MATSSPEALRLELLGGLNITQGGAPVRGFLSSKVQALLCYLVVTGRTHRRDSLVSLLWGDMPEERAAHGLRQALSNLQKLAGPHIAVTRETVAFNRAAPYYLDSEAFLGLLKEAQSVPFGARRKLRDAVELYEGDFLSGFYVRDAPAFDEWAAGQRELLRHEALDAFHKLGVHHTSRGEYTVAIGYLRRLLELDPWREDVHRQLMLLLAYEGQSGAVIAQYKACCRVLSEELGEEPSAETTELYRRIRAGEIETPPGRDTPGNLPAQLDPVIGRQAEIAKIQALLEDPACRLLTLAGPGGVGKTRLAMQVAADLADEFEHGVFCVSLASISDPELVLGTVAHTLSIEDSTGSALLESLRTAMRDREILLLLDNFEHVLPAATLISELLRASPRLRVMVTSRANLRLRNEVVHQVPPLALPPLDDPALPEVVSQFPAAAMFTERARAARPDFAITDANARTVAEICHRLEGLPLAIELAAARLNIMPVHALLARLEHRLGILTGGSRDHTERQQTLRSTLRWSYDLLDEPQREVFKKLSVFTGGWTLEAAEAVCDLSAGYRGAVLSLAPSEMNVVEGLSALVDNSLVQREEKSGGELRFRMLETIREYALEQLQAAGDEEGTRHRHADYFLRLAQLAEPELRGGEQRKWLDSLETEHDNLRAVLAWAGGNHAHSEAGDEEAAHNLELGLRLCGIIWRLWYLRGYLSEGRKWLEELLARPGAVPPEVQAQGLRAAGILAFTQGDLNSSATFCEQGLELYSLIDDKEGSAGVLNSLGNARREQGAYDVAVALYEQALALYRELDDTHGISVVLNNLGAVAQHQGDLVRASALFEESLSIRRTIADTAGIAYTLNKLAEVAREEGFLDRAEALCEESLQLRQALGNKHGIALALINLGMIVRDRADGARAEAIFDESLVLCRELGETWGIATALNSLGLIASERREYRRALELCNESLSLFRANGDTRGVAMALSALGQVALGQGDIEGAVRLFEESLELRRQLGDARGVADDTDRLAKALREMGEHERAAALMAPADDYSRS